MALLNGDDKKKKKGKKLPSGILLPDTPAMQRESTRAVLPRPDYGPTPIQTMPTVNARGVQGATTKLNVAEMRGREMAEESETRMGIFTVKPGTVRWNDKLDWGQAMTDDGPIDRRTDGYFLIYQGANDLAKLITLRDNGTKQDAQDLFDVLVYMMEPPMNKAEMDAYIEWATDIDSPWEEMPKGTLGVEGIGGLPNPTGVPLAIRDVAKDISRGEVNGYTFLAAIGALPVLGPIVRSSTEIAQMGGIARIEKLAKNFMKDARKLQNVEVVSGPSGNVRHGLWKWRLKDRGNIEMTGQLGRSDSGTPHYASKSTIKKLDDGDITWEEGLERGLIWPRENVAAFNITSPWGHGWGYGGGEVGTPRALADPSAIPDGVNRLTPVEPGSHRGELGSGILRQLMRLPSHAEPEVRGYYLGGRITGNNPLDAETEARRARLMQAGHRVGVAMPAVPGRTAKEFADLGAELTPTKVRLFLEMDDATGSVLEEVLMNEFGMSKADVTALEAQHVAMTTPWEFQPTQMRALEDRVADMHSSGMSRDEIVQTLLDEPEYSKFNTGYSSSDRRIAHPAEFMIQSVVDGVVPGPGGAQPVRYSVRKFAGLSDEAMAEQYARMEATGTSPKTRTQRVSGMANQQISNMRVEMQNLIRANTGDDSWTVTNTLDPTDLDRILMTLENGSGEAVSFGVDAAGSTVYPELYLTAVSGDDDLAAALFEVVNSRINGRLQYQGEGIGDIVDMQRVRDRIGSSVDEIARVADEFLETNPDMSVEEAVAAARAQAGSLSDRTDALIERERGVNSLLGRGATGRGADERIVTRTTERESVRHQQSRRAAVEQATDRGFEVAENLRGSEENLITNPMMESITQRADEVIAAAPIPERMHDEARSTYRAELLNRIRTANNEIIHRATRELGESDEAAAVYTAARDRGLSHQNAVQELERWMGQQLRASPLRAQEQQTSGVWDMSVRIDEWTGREANRATVRLNQQRQAREGLSGVSIAQGEARAGLPRGEVEYGPTNGLEEFVRSTPADEPGAISHVFEREQMKDIALKLNRGEYASPAHAVNDIADRYNFGATKAGRAFRRVLDRMGNDAHAQHHLGEGVTSQVRFGGADAPDVRAEAHDLAYNWHQYGQLSNRDYEAFILATRPRDAGDTWYPAVPGTERSEGFLNAVQMLNAGEAERLSGRAGHRADFEQVRAATIEQGLTPDMDPHTNMMLRQAIAADAQYLLRTGQANDLEDLMEMLTREWDIAPENRGGVRVAVRQAMSNNHGVNRFRDGAPIDEDYYTYGILHGDPGDAATALAGAGASPEEMAYTLNMLGHRPGAIHTVLSRHFGQTVEDQTRHAELIEKISGENPFPGGVVGEPTPTAVPDPTPPSPGVADLHMTTPENMLPNLQTLNERQLSAIYTMLDTSRTYEGAYGGPISPDGIRGLLQSAGYSTAEVDTAMGYFGRQDLVDDFVRRTLNDMGWTPGAQVPISDLDNAMESEGFSAGFRDTMLRFVQDFASDESGSKVIGKATRPRASDEARIEEGYRAYQELGGRSDYQIRSMLSQEGFDFDAIEAVGERLTGRSYREARQASPVPEPEPGGMSRRDFVATTGVAGAGVALGGGGGLLAGAGDAATAAEPFRGFVPTARHLTRMHGQQYAENARQIWARSILSEIEGGSHPDKISAMVSELSAMPRGGLVTDAVLSGRQQLADKFRQLLGRPDVTLPRGGELQTLAREIVTPYPATGPGSNAAAEARQAGGFRSLNDDLTLMHGQSGGGQARPTRPTAPEPNAPEQRLLPRGPDEPEASTLFGRGEPTPENTTHRGFLSPPEEGRYSGSAPRMSERFSTPEEAAIYARSRGDDYIWDLQERKRIPLSAYIDRIPPDEGRYRVGADFTTDYPSQARRNAEERRRYSFLDTHTGRKLTTRQAPLPQGSPSALYPDPRKALLPSLLGGAYLGMRDGRSEEPTPKRRRLLDF